MERLDWTIRLRALTNGRPAGRDDDPRIGEIETFFRMPHRVSDGLAPIQNWVNQLVDYFLITEFDAADLELAWRDEREIDAQKLAGILIAQLRPVAVPGVTEEL